MASPKQAITRTELGATFQEFNLAASRMGFIGPMVLRPRMVNIQAADVPLIPLKEVLLNKDTARAPGAGYRRGKFEFDKYSYATVEHGWEETVDDRNLAIYRDLIEQEEIASSRAIDFVLRRYERTVASTMQATATFTNAAAAAAWSNRATATPITDVQTRVAAIEDATGIRPNVVVMDRSLMREARRTDEVLDMLKYSSFDDPKNITAAALAELFDVDMVVVAGKGDYVSIQNTANANQTASLSRIWDNTKVCVGRVATSNDPSEPCVGRTIMWSDENAGLGSDEELAIIMEEYREEEVRGAVMRARVDYDLKVIYSGLWQIITGC